MTLGPSIVKGCPQQNRALNTQPTIGIKANSKATFPLIVDSFDYLGLFSILPSWENHTLTMPSKLAVASVWPSGENTNLESGRLCPTRFANSRPVATSHNTTVA